MKSSEFGSWTWALPLLALRGMPVRFPGSSPLPRYPFKVYTGNRIQLSFDLHGHHFRTAGMMASQYATDSTPTCTTASNTEPLVMQIVVRRDLFDKEKWGVGPLMAQAAHAATAVLHVTRERPETIDYLADLETMRKVVLQTPDASTLEKLSAALSNASPSPIPHYVWIEQPENIPACIALAPNRKDKSLRKALDKSSCRLWRSD